MLVENYHQFPSSLNFGSSTQFFAPARGQLPRTSVPSGAMGRRQAAGHRGIPPPRSFADKSTARFRARARVAPRSETAQCGVNLPGWRWGVIKKTPLVAVSRPLHSGVCETRQDAGLPVIHSAISDSGRLRTRGGQLSPLPTARANLAAGCWLLAVRADSRPRTAPASTNWRRSHRAAVQRCHGITAASS